MSDENLDEYLGLDGDEIMEIDDPEPESLLGNVIIAGETTMIFGKAGCGKSWVTMSMCMAIAKGEDVFGWKSNIPTPIFYIEGEMRYNQVKHRLKTLSNGEVPKNFVLLSASKLPKGEYIDLSDIRCQQKILKSLRRRKSKLLVVDNISCLTNLEGENDASSWTNVKRFCDELNNMGIAVILVHHPAKKGDDPRGSSIRVDGIDVCIKLEENEKTLPPNIGGASFKMSVDKSRYDPKLKSTTKQYALVSQTGKWHTPREFDSIESEHYDNE